MVQVNEPMQKWERQGYYIEQRHNEVLSVYDDQDNFICEIAIHDSAEEAIKSLNDGDDIDDWEDGAGNPIPLTWDQEKQKFVDSRN